MLWIESIRINNCRLIKDAQLNLSPKLNIILGDNASGKTSFLEALNILSTGRSFRTTHISDVITSNKIDILVSASLRNNDQTIQLGINKSPKKTQIRVNKTDVYSQAELSSYLPLTVITPLSSNLITGSPALRRSFIDWISFYLFPDFFSKWKTYKHVLKQRNLCLKSSKHRYGLSKWTEELVILQPDILSYRQQSFDIFKTILPDIITSLLGDHLISLELKTGFPSDIEMNVDSLLQYYANREKHDIRMQRTTSGVHTSDFSIYLDTQMASKIASRGQIKLISIALLIAQSYSIKENKDADSIILVDDISSELDSENYNHLLKLLIDTSQQVILTSVNNKQRELEKEATMFHVKHGEYKKQ